jgi:hypothetical protein
MRCLHELRLAWARPVREYTFSHSEVGDSKPGVRAGRNNICRCVVRPRTKSPYTTFDPLLSEYHGGLTPLIGSVESRIWFE